MALAFTSGGSGGGGTVKSVTAGDTSIVVGGTATDPTIETADLSAIAADHATAANWSNNSKKITSLANGSAAQDAAAFGQIPTALPPNGAAGGDLTGSYPNPTIGAGKVTLADLAAAVTPGLTQLVYRYTVTGSDKASIDTGVDTPDAGSNDWTNGDLLEVFIVARTDDAGANANTVVTLNNDGTSIYDLQRESAGSTTVTGSANLAGAGWTFGVHGSGGSAGYASMHRLAFSNYAGTTFNKTGHLAVNTPDATAANNQILMAAIGYRSTSAITRLKIAAVSTAKLKVGSQLLIYKRLAS